MPVRVAAPGGHRRPRRHAPEPVATAPASGCSSGAPIAWPRGEPMRYESAPAVAASAGSATRSAASSRRPDGLRHVRVTARPACRSLPGHGSRSARAAVVRDIRVSDRGSHRSAREAADLDRPACAASSTQPDARIVAGDGLLSRVRAARHRRARHRRDRGRVGRRPARRARPAAAARRALATATATGRRATAPTTSCRCWPRRR